ncbi:MAG: YbhB/YbcL family Raf kinase inhibitor-like protein [Candidatus Woesearchaeota archaeon]
MEIKSPVFEHKKEIPPKYTCDGEDINPPLTITGIPSEVESLVLIMDDPDAPVGTFTHWLMWNIPPGSIEENSAPGTEGTNDFGRIGYGGPCPPSGIHRYFFWIYGLDCKLDTKKGATRQELEFAMKKHILAIGELRGTYSRRSGI